MSTTWKHNPLLLDGAGGRLLFQGEGRLVRGVATVELPRSFEALTRSDGRTVHLTPVCEDDEMVYALAASRIVQGRFRVRTVDRFPARHAFFWQVSALRADLEHLAPQGRVIGITTGRPARSGRPVPCRVAA